MLQPAHEQRQLFRARLPAPARPRAPAHEQRDRMRELFVVASAPSRPNRTCRKKPSATLTTARSSSSTVQYRAPDGSLTGNARIPDPPIPLSCLNYYHLRAPHPRRHAAKHRWGPVHATSYDRLGTPGEACRRGGALALRPQDLDPGQCLILLREKGETVRWQPVSPTLMAALLGHAGERHAPQDGQLLRYRNGRRITYRRYDHLWERLGRSLRWVRAQQISMHWIRHTTLTSYERRGVASDATFREKREDTRPGLQLPRRSQRAGRVRQQCGGDLRCHHPVASTERTLQPLPLHPVTRMMRQM